eukprot:scaffold2904_cov173-Amphora_coffeaeformis.AAC.1
MVGPLLGYHWGDGRYRNQPGSREVHPQRLNRTLEIEMTGQQDCDQGVTISLGRRKVSKPAGKP